MVREIPLTCGLVAIVDEADYEILSRFQWRATSSRGRNTCYAARKEGGHTILMHRQIMATPRGMVTDHVNGDGLDNRRANLRICTNGDNLKNRCRPRTNTSGFKGVREHRGQFLARVGREHLGTYLTAADAAKAYDAAAKIAYGEYARLNFPDFNCPAPTPTPRKPGRPRGSFADPERVKAAVRLANSIGLSNAAKALGIDTAQLCRWRQALLPDGQHGSARRRAF